MDAATIRPLTNPRSRSPPTSDRHFSPRLFSLVAMSDAVPTPAVAEATPAPAAAAAAPAADAAPAAAASEAAPAAAASSSGAAEEDEKVEGADSTAEYQPVVALKPVEVSTGEEQDEVLYKQSVDSDSRRARPSLHACLERHLNLARSFCLCVLQARRMLPI